MAQGTLLVFDEFKETIGEAFINLETDTFKMAFINTVPTVGDADPRWGAGGGTNLSTNEVSGTNYTAGGNALANPTYEQTSGTATYDVDDPATWVQHASGPTDIKTAVVYSDTDTGKRVISFIDMTTDGGTTPLSLVDGDITVTVNVSGIFTLA